MSDSKITVHVIGNAHLDPVWLWPWQAGLDEVLATCRTMCNLLDANPDAIFTAGEAWRYREIEEVDPQLLNRIRAHVEAGRWALVGGWWIQPDCNFPSVFGMRRQIDAGRRYFTSRFGQFPLTAYNVDSFGHCASLPTMIHEAGQRFYVMNRPNPDEMTLPGRLFRWREREGAPAVLTYRISNYRTWGPGPCAEHVRDTMTNLPKGIGHTMYFIGLGDHGGGPNQKMLEWVRENADKHDDFRLVFSSPQRFFDAVKGDADKTPEVLGELQFHAVGCYSVMRPIKRAVRRAEHLLECADFVARPEDRAALDTAWETVAFNHFHDILGGTSIPSANDLQCAQLGGAVALADLILQRHLRRQFVKLPQDLLQRMVVCNSAPTRFDGYVEFEPSLREDYTWKPGERVIDEAGKEVPYQRLAPEAAGILQWGSRLLWRVALAPGEMKTFRLEKKPSSAIEAEVTSSLTVLRSDSGVEIDLNPAGGLLIDGKKRTGIPDIDVIQDETDNWSHRVDRYPEGPVRSVNWGRCHMVESGPLHAAVGRQGTCGASAFKTEWRVYAGEPWVELILEILWVEHHEVAKLVLPLHEKLLRRVDGIPGSGLERPNSGREVPLQDWTYLELSGGRLGIVSPDVYALDATEKRVRLTLLRSPIQTHHAPGIAARLQAVFADQGEHKFRIRFCLGDRVTPEYLAQLAMQMHRPPVIGDLTDGMPCE
jgi:alpha-mannosidase